MTPKITLDLKVHYLATFLVLNLQLEKEEEQKYF